MKTLTISCFFYYSIPFRIKKMTSTISRSLVANSQHVRQFLTSSSQIHSITSQKCNYYSTLCGPMANPSSNINKHNTHSSKVVLRSQQSPVRYMATTSKGLYVVLSFVLFYYVLFFFFF